MKTVIIGLDGAKFDIIKPLVSAGRMPVLSRLMREGVSAPLRSTILPNSFPGWASCTTGTSEGMHGVFSPFIKNPSKYTVRAMSGRDIMTRPVWDILTEHGGRSIVLNVPTTYPPEPINGLMVTGMLTPGRGSAFTHPASLKTELLAEFPNFVSLFTRCINGSIQRWAGSSKNCRRTRACSSCLIMGFAQSCLKFESTNFWLLWDCSHSNRPRARASPGSERSRKKSLGGYRPAFHKETCLIGKWNTAARFLMR